MTKIIFCLFLLAALWLVLIKATDRICDKKYSKEFMQTQAYRDMQCPAK